MLSTPLETTLATTTSVDLIPGIDLGLGPEAFLVTALLVLVAIATTYLWKKTRPTAPPGRGMIIMVKEPPTLGRPRFAKRLADHLDLPPPGWPIGPIEMTIWKRALGGWSEADKGFFDEVNYLDLDRLLAILMMRKAHKYPRPPKGKNVSRQDFERWRDTYAVKTMMDHMDEFLAMVFAVVDGQENVIIDGHALGTSPRDTPLSTRIQARYSNRPTLRVLLKTPDGVGPSEVAPQHVGVVNRATYSQEELLAKIQRKDGGIALEEELHSARTRIPADAT